MYVYICGIYNESTIYVYVYIYVAWTFLYYLMEGFGVY